MGCAQSRIENEEAVSRCKERRAFMKDAVSARNAFAAAHSSYAMSLKNTGAALSDFGQGEVLPQDHPLRPSAAAAAAAAVAPEPSSSSAVVQPPIDTLPPPPPPLPDFSTSPLQRSASMPDLPKKYRPGRSTADLDATIAEEDDDADADDDADINDDLRRTPAPSVASTTSSPMPPPPPPPRSQASPSPLPPPPPMPETKGMDTWDYFFAMDDHMTGPSLSQRAEVEQGDENKFKIPSAAQPDLPPPPLPEPIGSDEPPVTPEKVVLESPLPPRPVRKQKAGSVAHHQHAASTSVLETKRGKMVASAAPSVNLLQILNELDDHFLKASESACDVSKMLEANRMHYHSNFADNRGHIDHSARVMRVITWNRSFKGIPNGNDARDEFDNDEWETHATVLDKMLAWEKKLYEEVKAGELMKIEYQRKIGLLNKQKKRGTNPEAIEKTKAAVSHLHTRYIVDMQSMDSTVSEIQRLRDDQLYPRLLELVDAMAKMWETMYMHHAHQLKVVADLRSLDISNAPKETSEHHYDRTVQLYEIAGEWQTQFQKLVSHQKEYSHALSSWLKLNVIPIESSLKEKVSSPPRPHRPPIQTLLYAWHEHFEKVPDDLVKSAISSFAGVINTIKLLQEDELKQKEKCEGNRKEYMRAFEDWYHKYSLRRAGACEEADPNRTEGSNPKDPVAERRFLVDSLKTRLEDEEDAHRKICKQVREKSLGSLRTHLPELFRAMSDFAHASSEMYKELSLISRSAKSDAS